MLNNNLFLLVLISLTFYSLATIDMNIYIRILVLLSILCLLVQSKSEMYLNSFKIDKESDIYLDEVKCNKGDKLMERDMDLRDSSLYINKNRAFRPRTEMGDVSCKYNYNKRRNGGEFNSRYIPRNYKKWCLKSCQTALDSDGRAHCES